MVNTVVLTVMCPDEQESKQWFDGLVVHFFIFPYNCFQAFPHLQHGCLLFLVGSELLSVYSKQKLPGYNSRNTCSQSESHSLTF